MVKSRGTSVTHYLIIYNITYNKNPYGKIVCKNIPFINDPQKLCVNWYESKDMQIRVKSSFHR